MNSLECHIIAGPNGAGKTTFAMEFIAIGASDLTFINADLIAAEISPKNPASVAMQAGRLMMEEIDGHVDCRESFAIESTLSGKSYERKIRHWKSLGYTIFIYYLKLPNADMAVERVRARVARGGHDIPEIDIRRRFARSWINFQEVYKPLADRWGVYDSSRIPAPLIEDHLDDA